MMNLTTELIEKAKAAASAEELLALAEDAGMEMTAKEAASCFAQLNPKMGELDEDDLDVVAGGQNGCGNGNTITFANASCTRWRCSTCGGAKGQSEVFGSVYRDACAGCGATDVTCRTCQYISGDGIVLRCLHP